MARKRKKPESAYERRIRRHLELHPGASRQEARGHRLPPGVRSEYARRVQGTEPGTAARRRASGHADGAAALLRFLRPGDRIMCDVRAVTVTGEGDGRRWRRIPKRVITTPWSGRDEREFVLLGPGGNGYSLAGLRRLIGQEMDRGAEFSPQPSLDQRRLVDY
jgi:hypothetical protein